MQAPLHQGCLLSPGGDPTVTTTTPSRILDTNEQTDPITSNGHTCTMSARRTRRPDPGAEKCGKPAVYEVIKTCCTDQRVHYWCAPCYTEHTTTHPIGCAQCEHVCYPGECLHRIVNPI